MVMINVIEKMQDDQNNVKYKLDINEFIINKLIKTFAKLVIYL